MEYINLKEQIAKGDSKLLKKLPGFVVRLLIKIIKQKELNILLNKFENDIGVDFLPKVIEYLNITLEYEGLENLPENGKCFFVSNHPYGIVDGLILTHTVAGKYGEFRAIGNQAFHLIPQLRPVIAAVNVFGTNSKDYLLELEKVYESDMPITHFPAGIVSRLEGMKVKDGVWQKSFINKAVSCHRDIVPFHIMGKNSTLFYSIFFIRRLLRINVNIELMLLPHEIFNKRNKTIKVKIGKPIPYSTFDKSKTAIDWAQYVKEEIYKL